VLHATTVRPGRDRGISLLPQSVRGELRRVEPTHIHRDAAAWPSLACEDANQVIRYASRFVHAIERGGSESASGGLGRPV